jgi:hypothetical protein
MTTIATLTAMLKQRNEQRLSLVREEFESELDALTEAVEEGGDLGALAARWTRADPALIAQIAAWQELSRRHHAVEYHQLALDVEPFLLAKTGLKVTWKRVIQTWFSTAAGNAIRVTYKRGRPIDSRIELKVVNSGVLSYFGPGDCAAIEAFLAPL